MAVVPFKDITVTGSNMNGTKQNTPSQGHNTYSFSLSSAPNSEWATIFNQLWQARKKNNPNNPQAMVSGSSITLVCPSSDDIQPHLDNIEEDVEIANGEYKKKLKEKQEDQAAFQERLKKLKFKNKPQ